MFVSGTIILRNFGLGYTSNEKEVQESAHLKLYNIFENFFYEVSSVKVLPSSFKLVFIEII